MDLSDFRLVGVLELIMVVVEIDGFHEEVKGSNSLLNRVELGKGRFLTFDLVRMMGGWPLVKIREIVFLNGRFWTDLIVVAGVVWILWQITVVLAKFTRLREFAVKLRELQYLRFALLGLFRFRQCWTLYFGWSAGKLWNCGYFPLILGVGTVLEFLTMAHLNVRNYPFAFLALSILITYAMFVKVFKLLRVRYDFPLWALMLLARPYTGDWGFTLFAESHH